jgi:hypothetical protein
VIAIMDPFFLSAVLYGISLNDTFRHGMGP